MSNKNRERKKCKTNDTIMYNNSHKKQLEKTKNKKLLTNNKRKQKRNDF